MESAKPSEKVLQNLKFILENYQTQLLDTFNEIFIGDLLKSQECKPNKINIVNKQFIGFPSGNFLEQIALVLELWAEKEAFPVNFEYLEGYTDGTLQQIQELNGKCTDSVQNFIKFQNSENFVDFGLELLKEMGIRGILTCLGIRKTVGSSSEYLLPQVCDILEDFNKLHTDPQQYTNVKAKPSTLTVGARALAKHAHRSSDQFWGKMTGTEAAKNQMASETIVKILSNAIWINIHFLPKEEIVCEARIKEGYGARWAFKGQGILDFRGFLEPYMEGGHEIGWRH